MADLVRDHIGLREVARRAEAPAQLVEEIGVDVDVLVAGTVERTHGRLPHSARRLGTALVGDEARLGIALPGRREQLTPGLVRGLQHANQQPLRLRVQGRLAG